MTAAAQLITDNLDIWASAIKTKSAAGRGKSSKLELYGIKKLRELILELAVRGLLVPQDPNDEPASELVKKIAAEKAKMVKDGKIAKPKLLPPIGKDDEPFALPEGWEWVHFGYIAQHNAGKTLDKGRNSGKPRDYLTTSNVYWGRFDLSGVRQMLIEETELEKCTARKGDLLICEGGEAGRAAVWDKDCEICFQNHVHRARFFGDVNPYYAYRYFEKLAASGEIENYRKGVGISNMSGKALASIIFALPPVQMQHRIVAKVDELMTLCDQLEQQQETSITAHETLVQTLLDALTTASEHDDFTAAWARIADHFDTLFTTEWSIDQLKQTILQLAVMGKLVPQDPNDEPASEFLNKISAEKAKLAKMAKIKKPKFLPRISDDERPFDLPDGWEWCRVWDIAHTITSGSRDWAKYYSSGGAIFVTMGNLSRDSYKLRLNDIRYVRPPTDGEGSRTRLAEKDLLISITGDVGNLGLIPARFGEAYINQHTALLRFMPECQDRYFAEFMRTPLARYQFDAPQRGVKNSFRLSDVGEMIISVAPTRERHRIVAKLDELMTLLDGLKAKLLHSGQLAVALARATATVAASNNERGDGA